MKQLGADAADASQMFLFGSPSDASVAVQHFFVARLVSLDESARSGPKFSDSSRVRYRSGPSRTVSTFGETIW